MNFTYKNNEFKRTKLFALNITPIKDINNQIKTKQQLNQINKPNKVFDTETFDKIYKEEIKNGFIKEY